MGHGSYFYRPRPVPPYHLRTTDKWFPFAGFPRLFIFRNRPRDREHGLSKNGLSAGGELSSFGGLLSRPPGEVELDRGAIVKVAGAWCTRKGIKKGGKEASGSGGRGEGEGRTCRFKVDESYRRKPIGRASISSNSATDPYPLLSHQRQHLSTNSTSRSRVRVK